MAKAHLMYLQQVSCSFPRRWDAYVKWTWSMRSKQWWTSLNDFTLRIFRWILYVIVSSVTRSPEDESFHFALVLPWHAHGVYLQNVVISIASGHFPFVRFGMQVSQRHVRIRNAWDIVMSISMHKSIHWKFETSVRLLWEVRKKKKRY